MRISRSDAVFVSRVRPLVACLAVAFGADVCASAIVPDRASLSNPAFEAQRSADAKDLFHSTFRSAIGDPTSGAPHHPTTTFLVKNCNDAGQDSLRAAVAAANMLGADAAIEFDLAAMGCSTITLDTGQIVVTAYSMTIGGPGPDLVTIDGGYSLGHSNRIFRHIGAGVLHLDHLILTDALYSSVGNQSANGGCIYSSGNAYLSNTRLDSCRVVANTGGARGGGVSGRSVKLVDSSVSNCGASSQTQASGGGVFSGTGGFTAQGTTISNNTAASYAQIPNSHGGGVDTRSNAVIVRSTISGNRAETVGGLDSTYSIYAANSTIAFNFANQYYGGAYAHDTAAVYNSTIAFNTANQPSRAVGLRAGSLYAESSIVANNTYLVGGNAFELDIRSADGHISGHDNLIIATDVTSVPPDTLTSCARLAGLFDNGGETRTIALLPGSPAIDSGDDPFNLGTDQRGTGFDRIVGPHADIGAYEWNAESGEIINQSGFESCE